MCGCGAFTDALWVDPPPQQQSGRLCDHPHARGLAWRFFLGALPSASDEHEAVASLQAQREQYAQWKAQLYPDFNKVR